MKRMPKKAFKKKKVARKPRDRIAKAAAGDRYLDIPSAEGSVERVLQALSPALPENFDSAVDTQVDAQLKLEVRRKKTAPGLKCHEGHPEIKLGNGIVVGGSCLNPRHGFDVYVGLDHGMRRERRYPWHESSKVVEVFFPVTDHSVPHGQEVKEFKLMIKWLAEQLQGGARVHVGCMAGHGRTGLVLAALRSVIHSDPDAIEWVRAHHCEGAVESDSQIKFLHKEFGCKTVAASKEYTYSKKTYQTQWSESVDRSNNHYPLAGHTLWSKMVSVLEK